MQPFLGRKFNKKNFRENLFKTFFAFIAYFLTKEHRPIFQHDT